MLCLCPEFLGSLAAFFVVPEDDDAQKLAATPDMSKIDRSSKLQSSAQKSEESKRYSILSSDNTFFSIDTSEVSAKRRNARDSRRKHNSSCGTRSASAANACQVPHGRE